MTRETRRDGLWYYAIPGFLMGMIFGAVTPAIVVAVTR